MTWEKRRRKEVDGKREVERKEKKGIDGRRKKNEKRLLLFFHSTHRVRVHVPHEHVSLFVGDGEQGQHRVERDGLDLAARRAEGRGDEAHFQFLFLSDGLLELPRRGLLCVLAVSIYGEHKGTSRPLYWGSEERERGSGRWERTAR
jgi:hypothetical protein